MNIYELIITIFTSIMASSGFWSWWMFKKGRDNAESRVLKGLAHDRILYLSMKYINRGDYITKDEYENLVDYLYKPYCELKGNGSAKKAIDEIEKLKLVDNNKLF